jgi:hypothetical protein
MEKTKEELKRSRKAAMAATADDTTQNTDLKAPLLLEKFGFLIVQQSTVNTSRRTSAAASAGKVN